MVGGQTESGPGGEDQIPTGTDSTGPAIGPVPVKDEALRRDPALDLGKDGRPGLVRGRETPKDLVGGDQPERNTGSNPR